MRSHVIALATLVAAAGTAAAGAADFDIQVRGGWTQSGEELVFARTNNEDFPLETGYGDGAFGELDVAAGGLLAGFGVEVGVDYFRLESEAAAGGALDSDCFTDGVKSFLALDGDCYDQAIVESDVETLTFDALVTYPVSDVIRVDFGGTLLDLQGDLGVAHLYPVGFESIVDRDTELLAYGLKAGAEATLPLTAALALQAEAHGSWVRGERKVDIYEVENFGGAFNDEFTASIEKDVDVPIVDASVSATYAVSDLVKLEVGGKYRRLFGAMYTVDTTANYATGIGSTRDDLDAWTAFTGLTIELN